MFNGWMSHLTQKLNNMEATMDWDAIRTNTSIFSLKIYHFYFSLKSFPVIANIYDYA